MCQVEINRQWIVITLVSHSITYVMFSIGLEGWEKEALRAQKRGEMMSASVQNSAFVGV